MLAAYQRERQGAELEIDEGKGFATWKLLPAVADAPVSVYLVDIFVAPDFRKQGVASALADRVAARGKARGAKRLIGTVDVRNETRTDAIKAILASGFSFSHVDGQMLVFTREIQ